MNKSKLSIFALTLLALSIIVHSCKKSDEDTTSTDSTMKVDSNNFLAAGLSEAISTVSRMMSDGSTADCYKIVSKSTPTDHTLGPWCPTNISDDASKGGIWISGGNVYDVDGAFIKNLATFYNDNTWQMYNASTGVITKTSTKDDCANAANPNVGAAYKNYCVECLPSYITSLTSTIYIPITPKKATSSTSFGTGPRSDAPSTRGVAFNGVVFDAPAPTSVILAAYTLAPFDDAGGHINLNGGYHYHAATGSTKEIAQPDGHAPMIGYALDGFGLYARLSVAGTE